MVSAGQIAVIRIKLEGIKPLIWRRVSVSTAMSLRDLHRVIQATMGWLDYHLWNFEVNEQKYSLHLPDDPDWNDQLENAEIVSRAMLLRTGVRRMQYVYDMGDYWQHSIIIEKATAHRPEEGYLQFLGGERRCPPEDCGGPPGYLEFLKNISSKQRKTREAALAWYGSPYDPDDIAERKVISALRVIATSRRER